MHLDRALGVADVIVRAPDSDAPKSAEEVVKQGDAFWPLQLARELEDAILHMRLNELSIGVWVLKNLFDTVPHEVREAALVDGAGPIRVLIQIVLPISSGNDTFTFAAFVTSIGLEAPVQGVLTRPVTLKVTGQGTWSGA